MKHLSVDLFAFVSFLLHSAFGLYSIFFGSLFMVLFAFFYSDKHPLIFFIDTFANQSFNRQNCYSSQTSLVHQKLVTVSHKPKRFGGLKNLDNKVEKSVDRFLCSA